MIRSLYVHIPFCERKCEYCDFTSIAGLRGKDGYIEALCSELRLLGARFPDTMLDTVFIGGGTPSLVHPRDIATVLATIASSFAIAGDAEVTMEANPSSITEPRARDWRAAGVNRISIGVQSLHAPSLRFLGRVHDAQRALQAVDEVGRAGFVRVNCDLIYAVPGLSDATWRDTLREVLAHGPTHISCYELTVEPGTPLHTRVRRGVAPPVDEEVALAQHALAVAELEAAGFRQYEVSNFALAGEECRHNLAYWHNQHYLAAGVGAHGHIPAAAAPALGVAPQAGSVSIRYWHGRGIAAYTAGALGGDIPLGGWEQIDAATAEVERLMVGLRLTAGIGVRPGPALERLTGAGLVEVSDGRVRATRRGETVLNAVVEELTRPEAAPAPCYA